MTAMTSRQCPFCGEKHHLSRHDGYTQCDICLAEAPEEQWDRRYDDWRSDGWPLGEVLVLYGGEIFMGSSVDDRIVYLGEGFYRPIDKCKWKPLPDGG